MKWYLPYLSVYERPLEEVSPTLLNDLRRRILALNERTALQTPVATVCIIAHNEERHLAACVWSLCDALEACPYPAELTVVNNRSTDGTEDLLKRLGVKYFNEEQKGPGHARQRGLTEARGTYYLCIDADTLYPRHYVETMVKALMPEDVMCAYGLWSFLPDAHHSAWGLKIYEALRDAYLCLQNVRRPELNVRGMVAAFRTEQARKEGFRTDIIRGEDGSLALALKRDGRLRFVISRRARPITGYGTLAQDGGLWKSLTHRARLAWGRLGGLTHSQQTYADEDSNLIQKEKY
jgi:glycosyltransferase involved in cell wall biosynthesis